jgi:GNAT superfamily N-acetyltransferase
MVVLPSCQGKGVGSRALRAILKEHCATARLPIHLETQEEPNVRFYQRLGWEVSGEQDHFEDDHEYKFHSWQMVHPGTTPASS